MTSRGRLRLKQNRAVDARLEFAIVSMRRSTR